MWLHTRVIRFFPNPATCPRLIRALPVEAHEGSRVNIGFPKMEYSCERRRQVLRQTARDLSAHGVGRFQPAPIVPTDPLSAGPGHRWWASLNTMSKPPPPEAPKGICRTLLTQLRLAATVETPTAVPISHWWPTDTWLYGLAIAGRIELAVPGRRLDVLRQ